MIKPIFAAKLRVGGFDYKVVFKHIGSPRKGFDAVGRCDWDRRTIMIDAAHLPKEEIYFTLFHELIHAAIEATLIDYRLKDAQDDTFIHPFSRILWDAMIGAGLIVKKWEKKKK